MPSSCGRLFLLAQLAGISARAQVWRGNSTAPRQVHLALTEAPDGMLVSWTTGTPIWAPPAPADGPNATSPAVRFGLSPGARTLQASSSYSLMYAGVGDITHRVNLTGLAPRTRYYYVVGDLELDQWSAEFSFLSRPAVDSAATLDMIAYGDMGYWNGSSVIVQAAIAADIASGARDYALVTHIGDISYSGLESGSDHVKDTQLWDLFMDEIEPISANAAYMVAPGNHGERAAGLRCSSDAAAAARARACAAPRLD